MRVLRACVAGVGVMGGHHVTALGSMEAVDLVALADVDPDRLTAVARGRSLRTYDSVGPMLEAETPDLVVVAVPTASHEAVAIQALDAGAHVLVEKPIASDVQAAMRIAARADEKGLLASVGHVERFNPVITELKRRLAEGEIGSTFQVVVRRTGPFPPRIGDVGVVRDLATHDLDVIRYLFDSSFSFVFALVAQHLGSQHEDLASVLARLRDGTIAVLDVNWLTPTKVREIRVVGEGGMYIADYLRQDLTLFGNGLMTPGFDAVSTFAGVAEGEVIKRNVVRREPLREELDRFVKAVLDGGPPPVPITEGIEALRLAEAILESSRLGHPIPL